MRPLPSPYDRIAAGLPATIRWSGQELLHRRLVTKDQAFPLDEREAFRLRGLLPDRILSMEEQLELEHEHIRRKSDDLEKYIGLAALQDRNTTLFFRLIAEHPEEYLPIVYTPTVGRACQEYSHIVRRTHGIWITPADVDRIPELLRAAPVSDVRLIVVTDGERILGLGDLGAGGMPIPIGKLALYTAAAGIHPAVTLPVMLDVGTDNRRLLDDPLYLGFRAPRLRGAAYDAFVEAFVAGVEAAWPGCLLQWEDFKQHNALRLLDRYRGRLASFNDDVQGTAAVVLGGLMAAQRLVGRGWRDERIVLAGAGAAGIGIGRLVETAMRESGLTAAEARRRIVMLDSRGLVHRGRTDLDADKVPLALPVEDVTAYGLATGDADRSTLPDLAAVVRAVGPTILLGTTGQPGLFDEAIVRAVAERVERPVILPLSNPTSRSEAIPADLLGWTDGRALVATGSPFPPVDHDGDRVEIGQANNVFIFPGVGHGAMVAEARAVTDEMFLAAARALSGCVSAVRLDEGAIYPPVSDLRVVSRAIAIAVVRTAMAAGLAGLPDGSDPAAAVDAATWWPEYVPYVPA